MVFKITLYIFLSFTLLYLCSSISYKLGFLDKPNKRIIHSKPTAYTGGIALSIILIFSVIIFDNFYEKISLIISIAFLVSIVGLVDDRYHLNIGGKLSLQIIPIFYMVIYENLTLYQIGDYDYFNLNLGSFSVPFTILSVLFLVNSFNYFDGIDGTLGFTLISVLVILYFLTKDQNIRVFLIILFIPISLFLIFNFSIFNLPKLFLGDSGSLYLGFVISFYLIFASNQTFVHPILLGWSIVIFVYEFLSINITRLLNRNGLFEAGQDHLHHMIFKQTNSIFLTNLYISLLNILLFTFGYLSFLLINPFSSLTLFIIFFLIFLMFRIKLTKKIK